MVGRSGNSADRFAPVTASARSLPARIWGAVDVPENSAAVSPATVAAVAGVPP